MQRPCHHVLSRDVGHVRLVVKVVQALIGGGTGRGGGGAGQHARFHWFQTQPGAIHSAEVLAEAHRGGGGGSGGGGGGPSQWLEFQTQNGNRSRQCSLSLTAEQGGVADAHASRPATHVATSCFMLAVGRRSSFV